MRIRELRFSCGIAAAELARRCHVSPAAVCQWESGKKLPRPEKLPLIAALLSCEVGDLYEPDELKQASEEAIARIHEKAVADAKRLSEEGAE